MSSSRLEKSLRVRSSNGFNSQSQFDPEFDSDSGSGSGSRRMAPKTRLSSIDIRQNWTNNKIQKSSTLVINKLVFLSSRRDVYWISILKDNFCLKKSQNFKRFYRILMTFMILKYWFSIWISMDLHRHKILKDFLNL